MTRYMYGLPPAPGSARLAPLTIDQKAFAPVPGHPYASYRTGQDAAGRFWIHCRCNRCPGGALWQKQCFRPGRANIHVLLYATIHGHGLTPQRR